MIKYWTIWFMPQAKQKSAELHRSRVWIFSCSQGVRGIRKGQLARRNIFPFNPGVCSTSGMGGSICENSTKGNPSGTNVSRERRNMLLGNLANAKTKTHTTNDPLSRRMAPLQVHRWGAVDVMEVKTGARVLHEWMAVMCKTERFPLISLNNKKTNLQNFL